MIKIQVSSNIVALCDLSKYFGTFVEAPTYILERSPCCGTLFHVFLVVCFCFCFLKEPIFYKNVQAEIDQHFKNILRTDPG